MNILLIRPDDFNTDYISKLRKQIARNGIHGGVLHPLGLCYVAAASERAGHKTKILDMRAQDITENEFKKIIQKFSSDLIGIYMTSFDIKKAVLIGEKIKEMDKSIPVVVGGPGVSVHPKETLMHDCFDYGIVGEVDLSFPMFLNHLNNGLDNKIPGLIYKKNGTPVISAPIQIVKDLDSLPFPARHLLNGNYNYVFVSREPFTSMMTSRGCPFNCSFCGKPPGRGLLRFRSVENVIDEFKCVVEDGYKEVILFDDTFTLNKKHVEGMCDGIIREGLDIIWSARARIDTVNRNILKKMKRAGCKRLYFGVESGTNYILKLMNKMTTISQIEKAIRLAKENGFETIAYFILGFPGETVETMSKTIEFAKKINTNFCSFNTFNPLPASPVMNDMIKLGFKDEWVDFISLKKKEIPTYYGDLEEEVVMNFYRKAFVELYINVHSIWGVLRMIHNKTRLKNFTRGVIYSSLERLILTRGTIGT